MTIKYTHDELIAIKKFINKYELCEYNFGHNAVDCGDKNCEKCIITKMREKNSCLIYLNCGKIYKLLKNKIIEREKKLDEILK